MNKTFYWQIIMFVFNNFGDFSENVLNEINFNYIF